MAGIATEDSSVKCASPKHLLNYGPMDVIGIMDAIEAHY